jgi:dsRNA-specific ribonuclease
VQQQPVGSEVGGGKKFGNSGESGATAQSEEDEVEDVSYESDSNDEEEEEESEEENENELRTETEDDKNENENENKTENGAVKETLIPLGKKKKGPLSIRLPNTLDGSERGRSTIKDTGGGSVGGGVLAEAGGGGRIGGVGVKRQEHQLGGVGGIGGSGGVGGGGTTNQPNLVMPPPFGCEMVSRPTEEDFWRTVPSPPAPTPTTSTTTMMPTTSTPTPTLTPPPTSTKTQTPTQIFYYHPQLKPQPQPPQIQPHVQTHFQPQYPPNTPQYLPLTQLQTQPQYQPQYQPQPQIQPNYQPHPQTQTQTQTQAQPPQQQSTSKIVFLDVTKLPEYQKQLGIQLNDAKNALQQIFQSRLGPKAIPEYRDMKIKHLSGNFYCSVDVRSLVGNDSGGGGGGGSEGGPRVDLIGYGRASQKKEAEKLAAMDVLWKLKQFGGVESQEETDEGSNPTVIFNELYHKHFGRSPIFQYRELPSGFVAELELSILNSREVLSAQAPSKWKAVQLVSKKGIAKIQEALQASKRKVVF